MNALFEHVSCLLFDLDGCIYHGDQLADGVSELLQWAEEGKKTVGFVTNNSSHSGVELAQKLTGMGIKVDPQRMITATDYTGTYLKRRCGTLRLKCIGSESLHDALQRSGHAIVPLESTLKMDGMVIGRDTTFDYQKLAHLMDHVYQGGRVVATNPDLFHLGTKKQIVPETGAFIAAIQNMEEHAVTSIGKPAPFLFHCGLEQCGARPETTVMIGDNLYTDILGAQQAGMKTIWIQSDQKPETVPTTPDVTVNSIRELVACYV